MFQYRINLFQKSIIITFIFSMMSSLLNYFYQILLGNLLSVEEFGIYNSINSLVANLVIVFTPLSIIVCQKTAACGEAIGRNKNFYRQALIFSGIVIVFLLSIGEGVYFLVRGKFGVSDRGYWQMLLFVVSIAGLYNIAYSIIQGLQRFMVYGIIGNFLIITKLGISIINVKIGMGVSGILYAMLLSYLLTFVVINIFVYFVMKKNISGSKIDWHKQEVFKLYGITFISQILISFYLNGGEIILMSFKFSEREVGIYSSAISLGKISLYAVSVVSTVLLPTIASRSNQKGEAKAILYKSVLVSIFFVMIYIVFLLTIGKYLILFFFGEAYKEALEYLPYVAVFSVPLSIISIVHNFFLGIGRAGGYTFILGIGTLIAAGVIWCFVDSIKYVPAILGIGLGFILVISLLYVKKRL